MSADSRPRLVSAITGTYNRPHLINKCIEQIRGQDYPNIEHCIVSDGPDELLRIWHEAGWPQAAKSREDIPIKFVEAGRHWSAFLADSISAVPFQMAQWLSSGDYIMWAADDEEFDRQHISKLVNLLETADVDFVYSKSECWFNPELPTVWQSQAIGQYPPINGQITQALFRAELLDYCGFQTHVGSGTDWYRISTWLAAGASCAFLDELTHSHRVDKLGDRGLNKIRQPLRGLIHKQD